MHIAKVVAGAMALTLVVPSAPAAQQAGAPAPKAAPATAAAPKGFAVDVVGVRLGMTRPQAAVHAANPGFQVNTEPAFHFDLLPSVAFSEITSAQYSPGDGVHGQESLALRFTQPPNQALLWYVLRNKEYAEPERPTAANVIAALREKYGREGGSRPVAKCGMRATWTA